MKVSFKWLQTYFEKPLPPPKEVAKLLGEHIFEIEGIEELSHDVVLDVNVLPDRAPYCLSHFGIAKELSVLLENNFIERNFERSIEQEESLKTHVSVSAEEFCHRMVSVSVIDCQNKESPDWLKSFLHSVGQKSISLIVDLTNFVMLDIGQPMHAFDLSKVKGILSVRNSKKGESVELLGEKKVELEEGIYVIADDIGPLDIAGVKGGKRAEVSKTTNSILLTAGNFNAELVREITRKIKIKNESSKRFENNVSILKPIESIFYFLSLLKKEIPEINIGKIFDTNPLLPEHKNIEVSSEFISRKIGKDLSTDEILEILRRIGFNSHRSGGGILNVSVPEERKDINIKEDLVDEVVRVWGYSNLLGQIPKFLKQGSTPSEFKINNKIRNFLIKRGFSEIQTYTFKNSGDVEVLNALATDKSFLRSNLSSSMEESLVLNLHNAYLLGLNKVKIFEIGKIFKKEGESLSLCIGIGHKIINKKERPNDEIKIVRDELFGFLGLNLKTLCTVDDSGGLISKNGKIIGTINNKDGIFEINLDEIYGMINISDEEKLEITAISNSYKPIIPYPFATRDIAVFIPGPKGKEGELLNVIENHSGDSLVRKDLFDVFEKIDKETDEVKTSYAFRLVFQSPHKTLTDKEINIVMKNINDGIKTKGWEVR